MQSSENKSTMTLLLKNVEYDIYMHVVHVSVSVQFKLLEKQKKISHIKCMPKNYKKVLLKKNRKLSQTILYSINLINIEFIAYKTFFFIFSYYLFFLFFCNK